MIKKRHLFILIIFITQLVISGCVDTNNFLNAEKEENKEFITSKEITIPMEKPRTLNPAISKDEDWYHLSKLIYEGLFELDREYAPKGLLAKGYSYGEDGRSIVIELHENVLWHDGNSFTSEDVKFTIETLKSLSNGDLTLYSSNVNSIKSIKTIDSITIQIVFQDEKEAVIENLIFPIIPRHKFDKAHNVKNAVDNFYPIGTGPYKVASIDSGKEILLTANETYRDTLPDNTLKVKIMPSVEEAINLFKIKEIDVAFLKEIGRNTLLNDKQVNIISFTSNQAETIGFNFNHGALKEKNVRQAIAYAIDNETIIESCYYNNAVLNDSIYLPNYLGVNSNTEPYKYDEEKAKKLLKDAGYEGLSLNLVFNGENNSRNTAAQIIQSNLENIGMSVTLHSLNWESYVDAINSKEYDIFLGGYSLGYNGDIRDLLHSDYGNDIDYSNIGLDFLLDKMRTALSIDKKKKTFDDINVILKEEIPYYCLLFKTFSIVTSDDLKGGISPYLNKVYNGCETWRLEYEKEEINLNLLDKQ